MRRVNQNVSIFALDKLQTRDTSRFESKSKRTLDFGTLENVNILLLRIYLTLQSNIWKARSVGFLMKYCVPL